MHYRKKSRGTILYDEPEDIESISDTSVAARIQEELAKAQETAENNAALMQLKEAMDGMDENYKDTLTLRYIEGKKISEISRITGRSQGTVKSLLSRGADKLRKIMKIE